MDTTVGYVLLGAALVPVLIGWHLAFQALKRATEAAEDAKQSAEEAKQVVADADAAAGGTGVGIAAQDASNISAKANELTGRLESLNDALKGMTGVFAPSAAFIALAGILVTAAIIAFEIIKVSTG